MRARSPLACALGVLLLALAPATRAQCGTGDTSGFKTFTVSPVVLTIPAIGVTELDRGWSSTATFTLTVQVVGRDKNTPWYVCLQADAATFPTTSGYAKPVTDLQWSLDGTTWTSTTTAVQHLLSGETGSNTIPVYVRLLVGYATDAPGTYGPLPLTFIAQF